ncbi:MAG: 8-amino-7-oxononanoate synthase [Thermodesulfovibrionales bacterium]
MLKLRQQGLARRVVDRSSAQGTVIRLDGRRLVNFSSNDYLGFASRPELADAVRASLDAYGFGAGASRLLAGGTVLHRRLEKRVAEFKRTEAALLFNSGYAANAGAIPALAGPGDLILSDELNHASIVDGCRLSSAGTVVFRHRDMGHLENLLTRHPGKRKLVVTDTVFSMDGDIADMPAIVRLCARHRAMLYLDDAHGTGVLGRGRGALAHFGISPEPWIVQMGTFSKALGSVGAFVAGSADVIDWLRNRARSFLFSTALPAPAAAASLAALTLLRREKKTVGRLWENRSLLVQELAARGFSPAGDTPIVPVIVKSVREASGLSAHLLEKGFHVPAIRPPTVAQPRVRITVCADHTENQIRKLVSALEDWRKPQ